MHPLGRPIAVHLDRRHHLPAIEVHTMATTLPPPPPHLDFHLFQKILNIYIFQTQENLQYIFLTQGTGGGQRLA